jgi:hypothetical protein
MNNNLWTNIYGQLHNWFQTVGVFIVAAVCSYFVENTEWTWKGVATAAAAAFVANVFTRDDHRKTDKAVEKAAVTGEVPNLPKGENS